MNSHPLVSVGIPTYNRDTLLKRAIESVIAQDYPNLEIIISDNASTDKTSEICTAFAAQDLRIKYIKQPNNYGGLNNFLTVLEQSQGKFFMWLGDDDFLSPSYISECVKVLQNDPSFVLVSGRAKYYFPNGELHFVGYPVNVLEETKRERVVSYCSQVADNGMFYGIYLREYLFGISGLFESTQTMGGDWIFLANVAFHGKMLTLEHINIHRDTKVYTRETYRNLAKNYSNPLFQGEYPQLSISISLFNDIAWASPTYDELSDWERVILAWEAQKIICQRHNISLNSTQLVFLNYLDRCQKEPQNKFALADLEKVKKQIENSSFETETYFLWDVFVNRKIFNSHITFSQRIAQYWLKVDKENIEKNFKSEIGKKHQELVANGIKNSLLSDEEKVFVEGLNRYIAQGWRQEKAVQHFLAASLYCYPHQLPEKWFENAEIPQFLVDYFVNFMFETPSFFKEVGEALAFYRYVRDWVHFIHAGISNQPDSALWQRLASVFTQRANFIPLYFNNENLKDIYVKRAEIMEIALTQQGFELDYVFPIRESHRKRIRIGFLSNHFTPQTETFATLPAFEYLNLAHFEVILYANVKNGHPLEKYCASRVDRLVQLPEDLKAKVQMIRQDNLDIIWIGTNITAVTNQIAILALHRLARIQINSVSSCVTGGMKNIDYYISGDLTEPENAQDQYQEKLISVKGTAHCYSYPLDIEEVTVKLQRDDLDINSDAVVFISGANFYKITPEMRNVWCQILDKIPSSVLVLYPYNPNWSSSYQKESFVQAFYAVFANYDIDRTRLKIINPLPTREDIKECLKFADVYLDSYPFAGVTSLLDPLEIGLPPITKDGNSFRSIMGAAMLRSIELDDLVVQSEEAYINLAVKLGTDAALRAQYRERILEKMANNPPFLDSRAYSAQVGGVLQDLFRANPQVFNLPSAVASAVADVPRPARRAGGHKQKNKKKRR